MNIDVGQRFFLYILKLWVKPNSFNCRKDLYDDHFLFELLFTVFSQYLENYDRKNFLIAEMALMIRPSKICIGSKMSDDFL